MTQQEWVAKWWTDGAEQTLRVDYPLAKDAIVFDVGAYDGTWTADLFARQSFSGETPTVFLFEPLPNMCDVIRSRFAGNRKIHVVAAALCCQSGTFRMSDYGHESSMHATPGIPQNAPQVHVKGLDIAAFISEGLFLNIDLLSLNVEGHEYEVLDRLLETGLIDRIQNLQIQFHDFFPEAARRRDAIRGRLALTHAEQYCYPFVWESWRRK